MQVAAQQSGGGGTGEHKAIQKKNFRVDRYAPPPSRTIHFLAAPVHHAILVAFLPKEGVPSPLYIKRN